MATVKTGIELQLKGFTTFINRLEKLEKVQSKINKSSEEVAKSFSLFEKNILGFINKLPTGSFGNIEDLGKQLDVLFKSFQNLARKQATVQNLPVVSKAVNDFLNSFKNLNLNFDQLADGMGKLGIGLEKLFNAFIAIGRGGKPIQVFDDRIKSLIDAIIELDAVINSLNDVKVLTDQFNMLASSLKSLASAARSLTTGQNLDQLPLRLKNIVDGIRGLNSQDIIAARRNLAGLGPELKDLATAARAIAALKNADEAGRSLRDLARGMRETNIVTKAFVGSMKLIGTIGFTAIKKLVPLFGRLVVIVGKLSLKGLIVGFRTLFNILIRNPIQFVVNMFRTLGNIISFLTRGIVDLIGKITGMVTSFRRGSNAIEQQNMSLQDTNRIAQKTAREFDELTREERKATQQSIKLSSGLSAVGSAANAISGIGVALLGRNIAQVAQRVVGLTLAMKALNVISGTLGRVFQELTFRAQEFGRSIIDAVQESENLQLTISTLQARELVSTGAFDNMNEALAEGQERAKDLINDFKQLAVATPFETADLAATFQQLQTFGFVTEEAKTLTQILATIPGVTGPGLRDIATVFGQIRSTGALLTQDLRQLQNRGIDVGDAFRRAFEEVGKTGLTSGEALELAKEGALSTEQAITALAKAIHEDFSGSLAISANTTTALLSALNSLRKNTLVTVFGPSIEVLKPFANALMEIANQEDTIAFLERLAQTIAGNLQMALLNVIATVQGMIAIWNGLSEPVRNAIVQFGKFAAIAISVTVALAALQAAMTVLGGVLLFVVNPISLIVGAVAGLTFVVRTNQEAIAAWANGLLQSFQAASANVGQFVDLIINDFQAGLTAAVQWGSGLIEAFVSGIVGAFDILVSALNQMGSLIAYWLAPGSPPRILPEIDQWGTDAANEYLQGFTKADFGNIQDFGRTLSDLIETLSLDESIEIDTTEIVNEFANAIATINQTGEIDEGVFGRITELAPDASKEINNLTRQYLEVIDRTKELESATNSYNSALQGLNELEESEQLEKEEARIQLLQEFMKSQFVTEEQRQNAAKEIAKIRQEQELRASEKQLKAAEDELETSKERIRLANEFKKETDESEDALSNVGESGKDLKDKLDKSKKSGKALQDTLDSIGESLGGLTDIDVGNIGSGLGSGLQSIQDAVSGIDSPLAGFTAKIESARERITGAVQPIIDAFDRLRENTTLLKLALGGLAIALSAPVLVPALTAISTAVSAIVATAGLPVLILGLLGLGSAWAFANSEFGRNVISDAIDDARRAISLFKTTFNLTDENPEILNLEEAFAGLSVSSTDSFAMSLGNLSATIKNEIEQFGTNVRATFDEVRANIAEGENPLDAISLALTDQTVLENIVSARDTVVQSIIDFKNSIVSWFRTAAAFLTIQIPTAFSEGFNSESVGEGLSNKILAGINSVLDLIGFDEFIENLSASINSAITSAMGLVGIEVETENPLNEVFNRMFSSVEISSENEAIITQIVSQIESLFNMSRDSLSESLGGFFDDIFGGVFADIDLSALEVASSIFQQSFDLFLTNLQSGELQESLGGFLDALQNAATGLGKILGAVGAVIAVIGTGLLPEIPGLLSDVIDIASALLDTIGDISNALFDLITGQSTLGAFIQTVVDSVVTNIGAIFDEIDSISTRLVNVIENILTFVSEATGVDLSGLQTTLDNLRPILEFLISGALTGGLLKLVGRFRTLGNSETLLGKLGDALSAIWTNIRLIIGGGLLINFESLTQGINQWASDSVDAIGNMFNESLQSALDWINDTRLGIGDGLEQLGTNIGTWMNETSTAISNGLGGWWFEVTMGMVSLKNAFMFWLGNIWNSISDWFTSAPGKIAGFIAAWVIEIISGILTINEKFNEKRDAFNQGIKDIFDSAFGNAVDFVVDKVSGIVGVFNQVKADLMAIEITENPLDAILEGIKILLDVNESISKEFNSLVETLTGIQLPNPFSFLIETIESFERKLAGLRNQLNRLPGVNLGGGMVDGGGANLETPETANDFTSQIDALRTGSFAVETGALDLGQFGSFVEQFSNLGKNMGEALNIAIEETAANEGVIQSTRNKVVGIWESVWGVRSPSTVMKNQIGKPLGEGIIEGLKLSLGVDKLNILFTMLNERFAQYREKELTTQKAHHVKLSESFIEFGQLLTELKVELYELLIERLVEFHELHMGATMSFYDIELNKFIAFVNAMLLEFTRLRTQALEIIRLMLEQIRVLMQTFTQIMIAAAKSGISGFVNTISNDFYAQAHGALWKALNSLKGDFVGEESISYGIGESIGRTLGRGIVAGVLDQIAAIQNAMRSAVSHAKEAAQAAAQAQSPSKLTKNEVGIPLGQGIAVGIEEMTPMIQSKMHNLISNLTGNEQLFDVRLSESLKGLDSRNQSQLVENRIVNQQTTSNISNMSKYYNLNMTVTPERAVQAQRNFRTMEFLGI